MDGFYQSTVSADLHVYAAQLMTIALMQIII